MNFNKEDYYKKIEFLRAMPNTSSKHGLGITAVFNSSFTKNNLKKVIIFLNKVGIVITVDKESKIDTFTGIIGSGPAYFFHLLKSYERKLLTISNGDKKMVNIKCLYLATLILSKVSSFFS